jgi:UDP-N-acetyl-D-glucosamine dehydrogenase
MKLAVIGQGYVGLPVSMLAVSKGMDVVGIETDATRLDRLLRGSSYIEDVTDVELLAARDSGRYTASSDYRAARDFDVAVITVPTPLRDAGPDLSFLEEATRSLVPFIRPGCTVVVESTTYPGTTQDLVAPILEAGTGLVAGTDFALGFSPERIDPGNAEWRLENTPKVVSGIGAYSLERIQGFYDQLVDHTVAVPSPKEAELAKLLENTFRHVNIALVNQLTIVAHELGIDLWASIDAAATKPFGFMKFSPGPGVGGHCLPIDPTYLSWEVKRRVGHSLGFIDLSNEVNTAMPRYVAERAVLLLNEYRKAANGARVLLLGLGYKKNSGDIRESPAVRVAERLHDLQCELFAVDSHVPEDRYPEFVTPARLTAASVADADLVVILTDHDDVDYDLLLDAETPVLDTRRRLGYPTQGHIRSL